MRCAACEASTGQRQAQRALVHPPLSLTLPLLAELSSSIEMTAVGAPVEYRWIQRQRQRGAVAWWTAADACSHEMHPQSPVQRMADPCPTCPSHHHVPLEACLASSQRAGQERPSEMLGLAVLYEPV